MGPEGATILSRRVPNAETELIELIAQVRQLSAEVLWAIDLNAGGGALLIALLVNHGQQLLYVPGRTVHHASCSYRGSGRSDDKDAFIIADKARMRRNLHPMTAGDEIAVDLRILTARRDDLVADRTRAINRLRAQILEYVPALERAFDYSNSKAALFLLTGYQIPAALRECSQAELTAWLRARKVRNSVTIAAAIVARLAKGVTALDEETAQTDALIQPRFRQHRHAPAILSMPGLGPILGAGFVVATGGNLAGFATPGCLASHVGLVPVPRDSGRAQGNLRRPRRYNRRLLAAFYLSAQCAITWCPQPNAFYDRKVRHEALGVRVEVRDLRRPAVAAAG